LTVEQKVPAQQRAEATSHASPLCKHMGAAASGAPGGRHTVSPGGPPHVPTQQSPAPAQGAPTGAQAGRQNSEPVASGRQKPEQHCAGQAHAPESATHAAAGGPWQRFTPSASARQASAPLPQHSSLFAHRSPSCRQPIVLQRPTPSDPTAHVPEQQFAATAQRSPAELHPPGSAQRFGPTSAPPPGAARQAPEQHSLSSLQVSPAISQPGSALHSDAPDGAATQWPPQQSPARPHVSPATRHAGRSAQRSAPSPPGRHAPPQQSWSPAHASPAGRQVDIGIATGAAHAPAAQASPQQAEATVQAPATPPHCPAAQRPATGSQNSEQQAPARAHGCPSDAHPSGD
jgi:hypothetical protein